MQWCLEKDGLSLFTSTVPLVLSFVHGPGTLTRNNSLTVVVRFASRKKKEGLWYSMTCSPSILTRILLFEAFVQNGLLAIAEAASTKNRFIQKANHRNH